MPQQLVLEPLGIVTEPNKLGQIPAGALADALNVVERSPGVLENMRSWSTIGTIPNTSGSTTCAFVVATPGPYMLVFSNGRSIGNNAWQYVWMDQATGTVLYSDDLELNIGSTNYTQSFDISGQPGFSAIVMGDQIYVNAYSNVLVWDTYTPSSAAEAAPRFGGMFVAPVVDTLSAGAGTAIEADQWVAYTSIVKREQGDRLMVSAPCAAIQNVQTGNINVEVTIRNGLHRAGDTIEIYRTKSKPDGQTFAYQDFQPGEEVGPEYNRATSYTLKAADIPAVQTIITIVDSTPDSALGEALYTNQSREGGGAAAFPPPAAELLVAYKGYLFGFGITRPPTIQVRPTGYWGQYDPAMASEIVAGGVITGLRITGCSYSAGPSPTTVTCSPASQTDKLVAGGVASTDGTGWPASTILSVGSGTFVVDNASSATESGRDVQVEDVLEFGNASAFAGNWRLVAASIGNKSGVDVWLYAPVLKLPDVSASSAYGEVNQKPTDGVTVIRWVNDDARTPMEMSCSRGENWDPKLPTTDIDANLQVQEQYQPAAFAWSEKNEPDAWPLLNKDFFTTGKPCAVASTKDAIVAFYTDAIWAVSGTGGSAAQGYDWRADPILKNVTISGSQDVAVFLDRVYARTSEGLVVIEGAAAVQSITQGRVHDQLDTPPWDDGPFNADTASFLVVDEENSEILMREPSAANGSMWVYNVNTDRLSRTISHANPVHADYSRFWRAPLVVGKDSSTWTVKAPVGAYGDFSLTYQRVYADNPFVQRHWQTLNVTAETAGATVTPTFNSTVGSTRTLDSDGRAGFEVPMATPAVGNTLQVKLDVQTSVRTKLWGFALDYKDYTDRRHNR